MMPNAERRSIDRAGLLNRAILSREGFATCDPRTLFAQTRQRTHIRSRVASPHHAVRLAGPTDPNLWQIAFMEETPLTGKARIAAYLLMVGLGGLEPPTSSLSGAFKVLYA